MKKLLAVGVVLVVALWLLGSAAVAGPATQTIFLEPFASDGERTATTLRIDGGHFWVAVGIYAFERTPVTVKIPYHPEGQWPSQAYRFVDTYTSEGVTGEWSGLQAGYFVFTGEVGPYTGEPDIVGLELEAVLDSINEFTIIVEANGREYVADPVTVIIGGPPVYQLYLPIVAKTN